MQLFFTDFERREGRKRADILFFHPPVGKFENVGSSNVAYIIKKTQKTFFFHSFNIFFFLRVEF